MASRRFFAYDPYDYYYTTPYHYPYPYHQQQAAPAHRCSGFFPVAADAEPAAVRRAAAVDTAPRARSVLIPVHFVGSDPEAMPERKAAALRAEPVARTAVVPVNVKRAPSAEEAAVRVQAAARGFMARRSVRAVREVEREAEKVGRKVAREAEALRGDARARVAVGEALMRLLLRLDAVRGAREYRRRVTRRVLALQDAVDALEPKTATAPAADAVAEEMTEAEDDTAAVEIAEESAVVPRLPDAVDHVAENNAKAAAETADGMEVDGEIAGGEPEKNRVEREPAPRDANLLDVDDKPDECENMVADEPAPAAAGSPREAPTQQEAAPGKEIRTAAETGGPDAKRLMEMVAALCERSAQQCAVIGALAERVDALERAVRRVEDAERRRRRAKKLRKEGKGSNRSKCYADGGL
ncbi:cilia- and flagella-associated protein 91-like [Panicum virgatum]|uniref:BAG domain-containing protein n=1 Tax=Panicum virgatum TaxID=38727 RepID=A0A8T0P6F0_PANVG|nr:cilia- and flagella-associated protein 91-like [Panicum virgatum]KAG2557751.1 hypothetical protein PVAP13_8NG223000 [Panicum virgatum]